MPLNPLTLNPSVAQSAAGMSARENEQILMDQKIDAEMQGKAMEMFQEDKNAMAIAHDRQAEREHQKRMQDDYQAWTNFEKATNINYINSLTAYDERKFVQADKNRNAANVIGGDYQSKERSQVIAGGLAIGEQQATRAQEHEKLQKGIEDGVKSGQQGKEYRTKLEERGESFVDSSFNVRQVTDTNKPTPETINIVDDSTRKYTFTGDGVETSRKIADSDNPDADWYVPDTTKLEQTPASASKYDNMLSKFQDEAILNGVPLDFSLSALMDKDPRRLDLVRSLISTGAIGVTDIVTMNSLLKGWSKGLGKQVEELKSLMGTKGNFWNDRQDVGGAVMTKLQDIQTKLLLAQGNLLSLRSDTQWAVKDPKKGPYGYELGKVGQVVTDAYNILNGTDANGILLSMSEKLGRPLTIAELKKIAQESFEMFKTLDVDKYLSSFPEFALADAETQASIRAWLVRHIRNEEEFYNKILNKAPTTAETTPTDLPEVATPTRRISPEQAQAAISSIMTSQPPPYYPATPSNWPGAGGGYGGGYRNRRY